MSIEKRSQNFFSLRAKAYFNDQRSELNEIIGKEVTITLENNEDVSSNPRYMHGYVSAARLEGKRVSNTHKGENYKNIELLIEPKLRFAEYRKKIAEYFSIKI